MKRYHIAEPDNERVIFEDRNGEWAEWEDVDKLLEAFELILNVFEINTAAQGEVMLKANEIIKGLLSSGKEG